MKQRSPKRKDYKPKQLWHSRGNKRDNPSFMNYEKQLNEFHPGPDRENSERK